MTTTMLKSSPLLLARAIVPFYLCAAAMSQSLPEPPAARNTDGYYDSGASYWVIPAIPTPITERDIDRWSVTMNLNDRQRQVFSQLHREYVSREEEIHRKHIQPLWDRSADIAASGTSWNVALFQEFRDLIETERPRVVVHLVGNEDRLFEELAPHLQETQFSLLEHVKKQRQRARVTRQATRIPGGDLDLTLLIDVLRLQGADTTLTEPDEFAARLAEYDATVTPLFDQRADAIVKVSGEAAVLSAIRMSMDATQHTEADQLRERAKALRRGLVSVERRIHDVNARYLSILSASLPEATAGRLVNQFRELVYEPVYPDPTDVAYAFDAALEVKSLTEDQRANMEANKHLYQAKQIELCNRMAIRFLDWREFHGVEWALPQGKLAEYEGDMQNLHAARVANAELVLEVLAGILTPEQYAQLDETISLFRSRMASFTLTVDRRFSR